MISINRYKNGFWISSFKKIDAEYKGGIFQFPITKKLKFSFFMIEWNWKRLTIKFFINLLLG
jgi:hypothetical protein